MYSNNLDKYEYLTGDDLCHKPSTVVQAKFEYSPLGKIFNKGLDKDDKQEGLFKRIKNIEKSQSSNSNNSSSPRSESSEKTLVIYDKDEDEDENEKIDRDLYQSSIEGMKGLKLPGEIESKDEKSQMYLENNINKIRNNFHKIYNKYQRFFKHTTAKGKKTVLTTNCFHLKLKVLIFLRDMMLCTII